MGEGVHQQLLNYENHKTIKKNKAIYRTMVK
jgi:hypothetical protein